MPSSVQSFVLHGIEPGPCEVEVDTSGWDNFPPPKPTVVGLPDAAVKESVERVMSAVANSGYLLNPDRVIVSLAPADVRKVGPRYDLPMAVGLLHRQQAIRTDRHAGLLFAGELALDGRLRPVSGVINLALLARREGAAGVVVPAQNAAEASAVEGVAVYAAGTLQDVVDFLNGDVEIQPRPAADLGPLLRNAAAEVDFADVRGQEGAKRALLIAAAGSHNALMLGPQGTGKTLMAKALPGLLPPLCPDEALEVTRIYSSIGQVPRDAPLVTSRPVRTPHHTASPAAVIGGGSHPRPGEVSLAHLGVLFLDELPEFPRAVLETLRQPLEDGVVTIARASGSVSFPARVMLLAAMNPTTQGGNAGDAAGKKAQEKYLSKLSGPLIDRIDIHVEVPPVPHAVLMGRAAGTSTAQMRERVVAARAIQSERNGGGLRPNATLSHRRLDELCRTDAAAEQLLGQAMSELGLSARAYDKVRRVARTIADLEGAEAVGLPHVAEAVQYRVLDRA